MDIREQLIVELYSK